MVRKGNEVGVAGVASAGAGLRQSSELSLPDETNGLGLASGGSAIDAGAGGQSSESSLASMAPSPTPRAKAAAPVGAKARGVGGPSSSELALGDGCAGDAWVGVSGFAGRAAVLRGIIPQAMSDAAWDDEELGEVSATAARCKPAPTVFRVCSL